MPQLNKAGTGAGANYISGTGENFNLIEFQNDGTTKNKPGIRDSKALNHPVSGVIVSIDVNSQEPDNQRLNNHKAVKDRNYPVASGYNTKGVPTYGDGIVAVTTTYPLDTSDVKASGQLNYMTQGGNVYKNFAALQ